MKIIMRFAFTALLLLAQPLWAETASTPVRLEINSLLDRLQSSGCQFNRNGTWYMASDAKAHLLNKLEYLEKRASVQSTEQFIDLAATRSSVSGVPYQVRCGNTAPVDSKLWLSIELEAVRSANKTRAPASHVETVQKAQ
jgi:hypothetical protein